MPQVNIRTGLYNEAVRRGEKNIGELANKLISEYLYPESKTNESQK